MIPQNLKSNFVSMTKEPTIQDVLDVLQIFSRSVDERFKQIESTMVTKDYLDDKLFEVRGEIANLGRKQDRKVDIIVEELVKRNIFDASTASRILSV